MSRAEVSHLKELVLGIDGVLEAAVVEDAAGHPVEIQAWIRSGVAEAEVRKRITQILTDMGQLQHMERTYVHELTEEPWVVDDLGEVSTAAQTTSAPPGPSEKEESRVVRPRIGKISLTASESVSHADVSLVLEAREAEGSGQGPKTPYALRITAATTLEAVHALLGDQEVFSLEGVSLVEVMKERMVLVIVNSRLHGGTRLLGAALVNGGQVYEVTVKATLDAVNRQLSNAL